MKIQQTRSILWSAALALAVVGLNPGAISSRADEKTRAAADEKPLFLHWIKPWYAGNKSAPLHIATCRITPSKPFEIAVWDRKLKGRRFLLKGRVDRKGEQYVADFEAFWLSGETYRREMKIGRLYAGDLLAFSGAYFSTHAVISHDRSPRAILALAAEAGKKTERTRK